MALELVLWIRKVFSAPTLGLQIKLVASKIPTVTALVSIFAKISWRALVVVLLLSQN